MVKAASCLAVLVALGCAGERGSKGSTGSKGSAGAKGDSSVSGSGAGAGNSGGSGSDGSSGAGGGPSAGSPGSDAGRQIFLLIGQSNMEGAPRPESRDLAENLRVQVLGYDAGCPGRTWNEWAPAVPPLHRCWAGVGPGDYFGKAMAEAWPNAEIGLVPCAISGVDIDFFRKGVVSSRRDEFEIPPDNAREGAYEMVIERARVAQQSGVIRGILFHQGESDTGNPAWVGKVREMVTDLRADLGLGEEVPFVAGELLYSGCCSAHNPLIHQLPEQIPNAHVVSAEGLLGQDEAHFDLEGQRELGARYAEAMLEALKY